MGGAQASPPKAAHAVVHATTLPPAFTCMAAGQTIGLVQAPR